MEVSAQSKRKIEEDEGESNKVRKTESENGGDTDNEATNSVDGNESVDADDLDDSGLRVPGPPHLGTLLICGTTNWDAAGRKAPPKGVKTLVGRNLYTPHILSVLDRTRIRLAVSSCNSAHTILITEEGKAMGFGRNEKGQLGFKDCLRKDAPILIENMEQYTCVGAAVGRSHTLLLTDRGSVFACGDNKMGQCGVNNPNPNILGFLKVKYNGPPIVKVSCGAEFSMICDCKGVLYAFGSPEYGQLGNGTTGEYIGKANKVSYNTEMAPKRISVYVEKGRDNRPVPVDFPEIIDFSCGTHHTVALDSRKRVFSWGWGGYGRLGHADTKDEMMPRLVHFFTTSAGRGIKAVYTGSSYSLAVNEHGMVFLFGLTKKTGEANMYPKPIRELQGWKVRSIGCSYTSVVLAADDSVISFGPSPTCGELGLGEMRKSSTTPMEIKKLEGIYVQHVSCGICHTVMIARDETEAEKERISKLPCYNPIDSTVVTK